MMLSESNAWFLQQPELLRNCLLALRDHVLHYRKDIHEKWNYGMPFYFYKGKRFCYLWVHKKYKQPYLGIVEGKRFDHPALIIEKRSRMTIMLFDPNKDLPIDIINSILKQAINLYK